MTFSIDDEHQRLANMKLPALTKEQKKKLEETRQKLLNDIIKWQEKHKYNDNKNNCTLAFFYQLHNGKLYQRGFMIAYEMDFRFKNPIKNEYLYECYRQVEDLEKPVVRGCYDVYNSYGWTNELRYVPNDKWHTQRGKDTMFNYGYDLTSVEEFRDIKKQHNILKYIESTIMPSERLVKLIRNLKKYPALEFVRKCKFMHLENDNRALRFLSSTSSKSKSFKKFLFKMYQLNITNEKYDYYKWYFDKYKHDIKDLELRKMIYTVTSAKEYKDCSKINYWDDFRFEWKAAPEELAKMLLKNLQEVAFNAPLLWGRYLDYLVMAHRMGRDVNDRYWQLPKNMNEAHNKLLEEQRILKQLQEMKELKKKQVKLTKAVRKFQQFNTQINGYDIFVPNKYSIIKPHVDVLHQCILSARYDDKMINGKSILIFIQKDKEPIASVEIDYKKTILQAYANEEDRRNCKPTDEVMEAVNQYLLAFNPNVKDKTTGRKILNEQPIRNIISAV